MNKRSMFLSLITRHLMGVFFSVSVISSAPGIIKVGEFIITTEACDLVFGNYYLNGLSFQQDAITSYNGWQYAVFYNADRYVTIARRKLPAGVWELLTLTDYHQYTNDSHNIISVGIAPGDGTIHLAFDHHSNSLHYRHSVPDLATHPENYSWSDSLFGPVTSRLVEGITVFQVTYPRFIRTPQGNLQFEARIGTSGDGESYLWEYQCATGEWISIGKFVDNPAGGNAYLHGLNYDSGGRLHTTWVKRLTPDASTNLNLYYVYSDDYGRTWFNNQDSLVGTSDSDPVTIEEPKVWDIPTNSGLINQEAQTADHLGRIHVFQRKTANSRSTQFHYWRQADGIWHETNTGILTSNWYQRSKIAVDQDNNIYAMMPKLVIASASAETQWTDWTVINEEDANRFHSEPLYDWYRLHEEDGILSVVYQERNSGNMMVLDYQLNVPLGINTKPCSCEFYYFSLEQNYPNPFNPCTCICFTMHRSGPVQLFIINQTGQIVARLLNEIRNPGRYDIRWDSILFPGGIYFYQLKSGPYAQTHKMLLIR
jgi:hypothetical protein